ncbi:MAG: TfoX/Sxy family protein [Bacteroidota bacterium]
MAYDECLAERLREALKGQRRLVEKKMFGGIAFMVRGNMCCGVQGNDLMARIGTAEFEAMLKKPHAREMDFTGKPLKGFLYIDQAGLKTERQLGYWVEKSLKFVLSLPPK